MLVFSPIIKGGEVLLEQIPLPYLLFKHPLPRLKPWAMVNVVKLKLNNVVTCIQLLPWVIEGTTKNPGCISQPGFFYFSGKGLNIFNPYTNLTNI